MEVEDLDDGRPSPSRARAVRADRLDARTRRGSTASSSATTPATSLTGGDVDRDGHRSPRCPPAPFETSVPGVFAIGDNRRGSVKRVATAVGDGAGVVQLLHGYLAEVAAARRTAA